MRQETGAAKQPKRFDPNRRVFGRREGGRLVELSDKPLGLKASRSALEVPQPAGEDVIEEIVRRHLEDAENENRVARNAEERHLEGVGGYTVAGDAAKATLQNQEKMRQDFKNGIMHRQQAEQADDDALTLVAGLDAVKNKQPPSERFFTLLAEEKKRASDHLRQLQETGTPQSRSLLIDQRKMAQAAAALRALDEFEKTALRLRV